MKRKRFKSELLAPAGDYEKAAIALDYGADAVFLGAKAYSLRSQASNFSMAEVRKTCDYAHARGKKVYAAVNVICHNSLLKGVDKFIADLKGTGVDAIIVADPYIIDRVAADHPDLEMHLSTQQSVTNSAAARFWKRNGVSRVVLAREVSVRELGLLMENLGGAVEIEYFVHGAVCISYSGRCMMSNNWSLRDANVGGCAQSCRWKFDLLDESRTQRHAGAFTMSPKDMKLTKHVGKLIDLGVASFKIEGRMKSLNYVATVTKAYRQLIDAKTADRAAIKAAESDLGYAENRPTGVGFSDGQPKLGQMLYHDRDQKVKQRFAFVVNAQKGGFVEVNARNHFSVGQTFTVFGPRSKRGNLRLAAIEDKDRNRVQAANKPTQTYYLRFDAKKPLRVRKGFIGRIE